MSCRATAFGRVATRSPWPAPVLEAATGMEALKHLEQSAGGISLVILDMDMPVMAGEEMQLPAWPVGA